MHFPIAIEPGDTKHAWGVTVPDLPGCFSAGDTVEEAMGNAREAILLHVEGLLDDEQPIPEPQAVEIHQNKAEFKGRIWALVEVELNPTLLNSTHTIPSRCH